MEDKKETMSFEEMKSVIEQAEQEKAQRFSVEYQRLCAEYGYELHARAVINGDGRIGTIISVRKINGG